MTTHAVSNADIIIYSPEVNMAFTRSLLFRLIINLFS